MQIVDFTAAHIEQAAQIAKQKYNDERKAVTALPLISTVPDLTPFAENGLGVAVFDGGEMVKYQCTSPYFLCRKPNTLESFFQWKAKLKNSFLNSFFVLFSIWQAIDTGDTSEKLF